MYFHISVYLVSHNNPVQYPLWQMESERLNILLRVMLGKPGSGWAKTQSHVSSLSNPASFQCMMNFPKPQNSKPPNDEVY